MSVMAVTEGGHSLPLAPLWIGVLVLIFFAVLLAITFAFRSAANRHNPGAFEPTSEHTGHSGHGAGGH